MCAQQRDPETAQRVEELERRVAELQAQLHQSRERERLVTDEAPVGLFLDDVDGRAIYINEKCAQLIGVPAHQALDGNWADFLHPDDHDRVVAEWADCVASGRDFRLEYRYVHPDGRVVWTLGEVHPVRGDDGKPLFFVGSLTDITAQREAEAQEEMLRLRLARAQKMESIGRLAGTVAHDHNNMLNVILGYAELAGKLVDPSSKVVEYLEKIEKAAGNSAESTRQLLAFGRKEPGAARRVDLNEAMGSMLPMLEAQMRDGVILRCVPAATAVEVDIDPFQLERTVLNLCLNARDATTGAGEIRVSIASAEIDEAYCMENPEARAGSFAVLSVLDHGCGMATETLERIFEPFFTTKDEVGGVGLGLSSVYGMVKQGEGFIETHSVVGQGTEFRIHLPLAGRMGAAATGTGPMVSDQHGLTEDRA